MRHLALIAVLCALPALAGCGEDQPSTSGGEPTGALVEYARSGGIAGMPVALTVEADGQATVEAGIEAGQETSFTLSAEELDQLRATLDAADIGSVQAPAQPTACADCFIYDISYDGEKLSYVEADEVPAAVSTAVSALDQVATNHLPAELAPPKS